jgi:LAO/AO transport system kinase
MWSQLLNEVIKGNQKSLARAISLVENEVEGHADFLQKLPLGKTPVVGITGPPGAGKSTLVDALIGQWANVGKKVAVLCVDPSNSHERLVQSSKCVHPIIGNKGFIGWVASAYH